MLPAAPHLHRFIRAVHRRLAVQRAAERVGVCVLIASAAALLLGPILWWRGEAVLPLSLVALVIGSVAGIAWGIVRRPTPLAAAMEADRQLGWHDLLGTACILLDADHADPWEAAVVNVAEVKCRQTRPSAVIVNRWGGRAWGGVGLAAGLVLTLSLIPARASRTSAAGPGSFFGGPMGRDRQGDQEYPTVDAPPAHSLRHSDRPEDESTRDGDTTTEDRQNGQAAAADGNHSPDSTANTSASHDGHGGGAANDPSAHVQYHAATAATPGVKATAGDSHGTPQAGTGAGSGEQSPGSSATVAGTTADSHNSRPPVAPWNAADWPADRGNALREVGSGRVPVRYHDLVRNYFDRQ